MIISFLVAFLSINRQRNEVMLHIMIQIKSIQKYIYTFIKWICIASLIGICGGIIGSLFHISVQYATGYRKVHGISIYFMPLYGLVIVWLYKMLKCSKGIDTNLVIDSVRRDGKVPLAMGPLIFISTVLTHLGGGSAGREGAALQLGGSIGSQIGKLLNLDETDMHCITLCGMSAVFAALFGTPLTAAFFAMEVISIGIFYYSNFIPCLTAALVAYKISLSFGLEPVRYSLKYIPSLSFENIIKVVVLGALCAGVSILFCNILHKTAEMAKEKIKNDYLRIVIGGLAIIMLTLAVKCNDYNGAGMDVIANAINGEAKYEAFILKIIFTAITIGVGFKGGEIVPTFFIGATFGCVAAKIIGIDAGFGAAIGVIALFCGVVNTLISSIILSIELFGAQGIILFAAACGVSYMLSGYYSLYSSQKIIYSKLKSEFVNRNTK